MSANHGSPPRLLRRTLTNKYLFRGLAVFADSAEFYGVVKTPCFSQTFDQGELINFVLFKPAVENNTP